ncbi:MAG: hypothetical protein AB7F53_04710, partial [Nitrososphaeraceae archaeon]
MISLTKRKLSENKKNKKQAILMMAAGMIFFVAFASSIDSSNLFTNQMVAYAQPNSNSTILNVEGSNALFEPAVGLTNVFGPEGLFPFTDVFK